MKLKAYLEEKKIAPSAFAQKIGTSKAYVSFLSRKERTPSLRLAVRIEDLTDGAVTVRDWLPETREPLEGPPFSESLPVEPEPAPVSLSLSQR